MAGTYNRSVNPIKGPRLLGHHKRLDKYRETSQLERRHCEMLIDAAYRAMVDGQPFNRFITLSWENGGIDGRENATVTGRFTTKIRNWAKTRGFKLVSAWVQEWGPVNKAHVHLLLHVPPHLDRQFSTMPRHWAKQCLGGRYVAKTVHSKRIKADWFGYSYEGALLYYIHYMLKCAPAELESELNMVGCGAETWGKSGLTYGKRLAVSQRPS